MQSKTLTLVVVVLLAFSASGVVAATTPGPLAAAPGQSPMADSPANHTVDIVDPSDKLSDQEAEQARQLAWHNQTVRQYFEGNASAHFHIEAVTKELEVYVASNSTTAPRVKAGIDLDATSVTEVTELENVLTADEVKTTRVDDYNTSKTTRMAEHQST